MKTQEKNKTSSNWKLKERLFAVFGTALLIFSLSISLPPKLAKATTSLECEMNGILYTDCECSAGSTSSESGSGGGSSSELDNDPEGGYETTEGVNKKQVIIVHTTEGDSVEAAKQALKENGTSYHVIIDKDGKEHRLVPDEAIANGAKSANNRGLHVALVGDAGDGSHFDPNSPQMQTLSKRIGQWSTENQIPLEHIEGGGVLNNGSERGVTGHGDVAKADPAAYADGHRSDPGEKFPWKEVLDNAKGEGGSSNNSELSSSSPESGSSGGSGGESSGGGCCSAGGGTQPSSSAGSGGGGGGCGEKKGDSAANKAQIWSFFLNKFQGEGYSRDEAEKATAGILGNWQQESGFNPDRHNAPAPGSGCSGAAGPITGTIGLGIAQWCGSRQQNLADFAKQKGTDISCLGTQLEFTWKEMQGLGLDKSMKGLSPGESSHKFDRVFEVSNGTGERAKKGENLYREMTGKQPSELGSEEGTEGESCPSESSQGGAIMDADCKQLVPAIQDKIKSGDVKLVDKSRQDKDLQNCTSDQIECGTGSGKGGVDPAILRALNAGIDNSDGPVTLWSFNTGHDCDGLNHPKGKAVDIPCSAGGPSNPRQADQQEATMTSNATCRQMIDYFIEHKEELGITEIIWQTGYRCDSGVDCTIGGHGDHIHLGVKGGKGGGGGGDD